MTVFQIVAIILTAIALGGYLNHKYIGFPATIAHMAFAFALSLFAIAGGGLDLFDLEPVKNVVSQIDFSKVVLHGMLSFLLFAGALHINLDDLKNVRWPVSVLATVGTVLATFIAGTLTWLAANYLGLQLPYIYALLFGALISPTDPIAVLSILKQVGVSKNLYTKIGGESLFNDGIGVVIFLTILGATANAESIDAGNFFVVFMQESLGGLGLGIFLGWLTYRLLRSIDEYKIELMLTLALVTGGYALAEFLHASAPLCMVAAALIVGNQGRNLGMSEITRQHLDSFWELIDEVLNAVLFFLIGLEIMVVPLSWQTVILGGFVVFAVLAARFISVAIPITILRFRENFDKGTIRLLTWGGLRGGLSIAMALSLPAGNEKPIILALTYIVVLFSIFVQGLTFKKLIRMIEPTSSLSQKI